MEGFSPRRCAICGFVSSNHMHRLSSPEILALVAQNQLRLNERRSEIDETFTITDRICCAHFVEDHPHRIRSYEMFARSFLKESGRKSVSPSKRKPPASRAEQQDEDVDVDRELDLSHEELRVRLCQARAEIDELKGEVGQMKDEMSRYDWASAEMSELMTKLPLEILLESEESVTILFVRNDWEDVRKWTTWLFIYLGRLLPQRMICQQLGCSQSHVSSRFTAMVNALSVHWGNAVDFNNLDLRAQAKPWEDKYLEVCPSLTGKHVFVVDGSGTVLLDPQETNASNLFFCHWKQEEQFGGT
jgi:hypothetical protein